MLSCDKVPHDWFSKVNTALKKLTNIWFSFNDVITYNHSAGKSAEFFLFVYIRQSEQNKPKLFKFISCHFHIVCSAISYTWPMCHN